MPENIFKIFDGRTNFWQWDTRQKLIVLDDRVTEVRFFNKNMDHSIMRPVYPGEGGYRVCDVPDALLQIPKNLIVHACSTGDGEEITTIKAVKFAVFQRPIPADYICEQDAKDYVDAEIGQWIGSQPVGVQITEAIDALKLAETYELIGSASVVDDRLTVYIREADATYETKNDAKSKLTEAKDYAKTYTDDEVKNVQGDIDVLERYVGQIPKASAAVDVIGYVQEQADNITSGALKDVIDHLDLVAYRVGNKTVTEQIEAVTDVLDIRVAELEESNVNKVDKVSGKGLSTNDYTTSDKNKLAGIANGANKTIVDTEISTTSTNPVQNKVLAKALEDIQTLIENKYNDSEESQAAAKLATVTLPASSWTGSDGLWTQRITISGTTEHSQIDLHPTAAQLIELQDEGVSLMIQNEDGAITACAIGGTPTRTYTIQAVVTELIIV